MIFSRHCLIALVFITMVTSCEKASHDDSLVVAKAKNNEAFDTRGENKLAEFVAATIEDTYADIKLAELANTKSGEKRLQDFAQLAASQYTETLRTLKEVAAQESIAIPSEEGERTVKKVNTLIDFTGKEFNKKWCEVAIKNHETSIKRYEQFLKGKHATFEVSGPIRSAKEQLEKQLLALQKLEKSIL